MRTGTFAPNFPNGKEIVEKVVQVLNLQKFGNQKTSSFGIMCIGAFIFDRTIIFDIRLLI